MTGDSAIAVAGLAKSFDKVQAVGALSFEVEEGELFGVIGPDGAGKTTLFRLLVSLLLPSAGSATVDGLDVVRDFRALRRRVGYMPGRFSLYQDLTVEENLEFFATIFGARVADNRELIDDLYRHLEPFAGRKAGALSGGMKQKLALCCALVHRPRVLFLDEPTTGVDAVSRRELWEMLGRLKAAGITVVVSTPYMDEAGRCDRVALIQAGAFLAVETPAALARAYDRPLFAIDATGGGRLPLLAALRSHPHARSAYVFGETVHYTDERSEVEPRELHDYLAARGILDLAIEPIEAGIEDVFMALAARPGEASQPTATGAAVHA
jgi:ABC-type multidrug transport system ATPase subunit